MARSKNKTPLTPEQQAAVNAVVDGTSARDRMLYPAIRAALDDAMAAAVAGPCEACGKKTAEPYAFAFAKQLGSETHQVYGGGMETITTYGPVAARAVNLCRDCVMATKRESLTSRRKWLIGAGAAMALFIILAAVLPRPWGGPIGHLAGLAGFSALVLVGVLFSYLSIRKGLRLAGSWRAIGLYRAQLDQEGFKAWGDDDLSR